MVFSGDSRETMQSIPTSTISKNGSVHVHQRAKSTKLNESLPILDKNQKLVFMVISKVLNVDNPYRR